MTSLKLLIVSLLLSCFLQQTIAQKINHTYIDDSGKSHLIGLCDRSGLQQDSFQIWYQAEYDAYQPKKTLIQSARENLSGVTIDIFMATWCGDSRREVPRFYKILDEIGLAESSIRLINVYRESSRYKQSPTHEEQDKLIHRVPTFIVYRDGIEIGRIVEYPVSSLEMDLAQILVGLPTDPNYKVVAVVAERLTELDSLSNRQDLFAIAKDVYKFTANDRSLNTYGYLLMNKQEIDQAIAVFTINTMLFARVPNVYDSLGEAYERNENLTEALNMYKVVISLDPENEHALEKIKELEGK